MRVVAGFYTRIGGYSDYLGGTDQGKHACLRSLSADRAVREYTGERHYLPAAAPFVHALQ